MFTDFNIIITVGPSILKNHILKRFSQEIPCIFRVNGAHGSKETIIGLIDAIRDLVPDARIIMDMPGNKIRTKNILEPINLNKGGDFFLLNSQITYKYFYQHVLPGDIVTANDGKLKLEVIHVNERMVSLMSLSEGVLGNNKGIHLKSLNENLPYLIDKDYEIIDIAKKKEVEYLGLSYVRTGDDIKVVNEVVGEDDIELVSKIELLSAVKNINSILKEVKHVIIDRGDLIAEVGIIELPYYQDYIIEKSVKNKVNVYLATQFLKSMENSPVPLIAEVMDLHNTFNKMISGIQLSEETAIGKYPEECLDVLTSIINCRLRERSSITAV